MKGKREAALRARMRALEAARYWGNEADVRTHQHAIRQLRKRLGTADRAECRLPH